MFGVAFKNVLLQLLLFYGKGVDGGGESGEAPGWGREQRNGCDDMVSSGSTKV